MLTTLTVVGIWPILWPHWDLKQHSAGKIYSCKDSKTWVSVIQSCVYVSQACKKKGHLKLYHANSWVSLILQGLFFDFISFNFSVWVGTNVEARRNYKVCKSHFRVQCTKELPNCFNLSLSTSHEQLLKSTYLFFSRSSLSENPLLSLFYIFYDSMPVQNVKSYVLYSFLNKFFFFFYI